MKVFCSLVKHHFTSLSASTVALSVSLSFTFFSLIHTTASMRFLKRTWCYCSFAWNPSKTFYHLSIFDRIFHSSIHVWVSRLICWSSDLVFYNLLHIYVFILYQALSMQFNTLYIGRTSPLSLEYISPNPCIILFT